MDTKFKVFQILDNVLCLLNRDALEHGIEIVEPTKTASNIQPTQVGRHILPPLDVKMIYIHSLAKFIPTDRTFVSLTLNYRKIILLIQSILLQRSVRRDGQPARMCGRGRQLQPFQ